MKKLKTLFLFVLLATAQFAYSEQECDPCDPCYMQNSCNLCDVSFCDVEFEVYVDALYWHVCSGDLDRYIGGVDNVTRSIDPGYSWGWRIGASAYWNSWDLGFRYTSFCKSRKEKFNYGITDSNEDVYSKFEFDFHVWDVEVGRECCVCEGMLFRPFFGGKFADIDVKANYIDDPLVRAKTDYDGCGLYVGFDSRWQICSFNACDRCIPVSLVSRFSTGVMDSDFKQRLKGELGDSSSKYKDCQFVPVHEVYAGFELRTCDLFCADAFFQAGYEAQYWGWREYNASDDITHLGLGGLVLRFGGNF